MFGSKINHTELQDIKNENQNLTQQLEKIKAEKFRVKR